MRSLILLSSSCSETSCGLKAGQVLAARGALGPGSEVVQELKDVIWKVGERRKSLQSRNSSISKIPVRVDTPEDNLNKSTDELRQSSS